MPLAFTQEDFLVCITNIYDVQGGCQQICDGTILSVEKAKTIEMEIDLRGFYHDVGCLILQKEDFKDSQLNQLFLEQHWFFVHRMVKDVSRKNLQIEKGFNN